MNDEKSEVKKVENEAKPEEAKKAEAQTPPSMPAPATNATPAPSGPDAASPANPSGPAQQPQADKKAEATSVKKEKPGNCAACNKSIKNKRWYYRNSKYYCSKRCWQTTLKKEAKPEESQPAK